MSATLSGNHWIILATNSITYTYRQCRNNFGFIIVGHNMLHYKNQESSQSWGEGCGQASKNRGAGGWREAEIGVQV